MRYRLSKFGEWQNSPIRISRPCSSAVRRFYTRISESDDVLQVKYRPHSLTVTNLNVFRRYRSLQ